MARLSPPLAGVRTLAQALLLAAVAAFAAPAHASLPGLDELATARPEPAPTLQTELPRELPGPCEGEQCGGLEAAQPETRVRGFELDLYCRLGGEDGLSCRPRRVWVEEYGEGTSDRLVYAKARYFDPELGRFLSQDSYLGELTEPPSLHRYLYAADNPTRYVDPDGHDYIDPLDRGCYTEVNCTNPQIAENEALGFTVGSVARTSWEFLNGVIGFATLALDERAQMELTDRAGAYVKENAPLMSRALDGDPVARAMLLVPVLDARTGAYSKAADEYATAKGPFQRGWAATGPAVVEGSLIAAAFTGLLRGAGLLGTAEMDAPLLGRVPGAASERPALPSPRKMEPPSVPLAEVPAGSTSSAGGYIGPERQLAAPRVRGRANPIGEQGPFYVDKRGAAATELLPQSRINRIQGNAFRDEVAQLFRSLGYEVETEVFKPTPFGPRFVDIEISREGKVLGGLETKVGGSRYRAAQRAKDMYLKLVEKYEVKPLRKP